MIIVQKFADTDGPEVNLSVREVDGRVVFDFTPVGTDFPTGDRLWFVLHNGANFGDFAGDAYRFNSAIEKFVCPPLVRRQQVRELRDQLEELKEAKVAKENASLKAEVARLESEVAVLKDTIARHEQEAAQTLENFDELLAPLRHGRAA